VTIILTPEMRQRIESRADSMLSSYWFDFEPTGDENVDLILGAVALAGKYAHSTEWWNEDDDPRGYSLADLIQAAANHAAGVKNGSTPGSPDGRETAINAPQPPAAIEWPKHAPTADELIRYAVGRAMWLGGCASAYVDAGMFERDDETLRHWHLNAVTQMIHLHDIALLLREMKVMDGPRADRAAEWIWTAAEAERPAEPECNGSSD